jgi:hypothetical protein
LNALYDINLIDQYAHRFGQLPRVVMGEPFDDVLPFIYLWKEKNELDVRINIIKKGYDTRPNVN